MKKNLAILLTLIAILLTPVFAADSFTDSDYELAGIKFMDSLEEVEDTLGPLILVDSYFNEIASCDVNIYKAKDVKVSITSFGEGQVWSIEVFSPNYSTFRGIKVGNSVAKVIDKYGEPDFKDSFEDKNGKSFSYWSYENMEDMKRLIFKVDNVKNVVWSIAAGMIID